MSFLQEVLTSSDKNLLIDVRKKIPEITSQIGNLKGEVIDYIKKKNVSFLLKTTSVKYGIKSNNLNKDLIEIIGKVKELARHDVNESLHDIKKLNIELQEADYALKSVVPVIKIMEDFESAERLFDDGDYIEAYKIIRKAHRDSHDIPTHDQLELVKTIKRNLISEKVKLFTDISKLWTDNISFDKIEEDDCTKIILKINNYKFQDVIDIFYEDNYYNYFNTLADSLLNSMLLTIINNTVDVAIEQKEGLTLIIKVISSEKMDLKSVTSNFLTLFVFVFEELNYNFGDMNLINYIGKRIQEEFFQEFINKCLQPTVPSTQEEMDKYKSVVEELIVLNRSLKEWGFFDENSTEILDFINNIDTLFAKKVSVIYLVEARKIIKKDLHDMIEVGNTENQSPENIEILNFPKCYVSRSSCEILNLGRTVLDQISTSSGICANKLIVTFKDIFKLYGTEVPIIHKKFLESIPQQVALFYNNCLYISHELIRYKSFYTDKWPAHIAESDVFDVQIPYLRAIGYEIFLKYMQSQIKQIDDILKSSELASLGQVENLDSNAEKSIRQCLRQLEILKSVWQKVLSQEIYNRNIGELLNSFIDNLIKLVLAVEDISANTSTSLVRMFNLVKERGPKLFTEPNEVNLYTKDWYKFIELISLLASTLLDINDRWSDGKGPLALAFTAEDIRRLIKALFQNTDRRAAVLAKIN